MFPLGDRELGPLAFPSSSRLFRVAMASILLDLSLSPGAVAQETMNASPAQPLDLKEAVQTVRTRGLDILLAEAATRSAEADERSAGAIPNPAISATYGRTLFINQNQRIYDQINNPGSSNNAYTIGLTDQAAIEDSLSGKRSLRKEVARAAVQAAKMGRLDAERIMVAAVKLQYFQLSLSEQLLDFMKETQNLPRIRGTW